MVVALEHTRSYKCEMRDAQYYMHIKIALPTFDSLGNLWHAIRVGLERRIANPIDCFVRFSIRKFFVIGLPTQFGI